MLLRKYFLMLKKQASQMKGWYIAEEVGGDAEVLPEPVAEKLVEIGHLQREDPALVTMCAYPEQSQLPDDEKDVKDQC